MLFVELLLIRWIPANVKYVGLLQQLPADGELPRHRRRDPARSAWRRGSPCRPSRCSCSRPSPSSTERSSNVQARDPNEIIFGLDASTSADVNFVVLPLLVVLVTALMASLALPLGPLLRSMPPLKAYAIDIGGSMIGIAAFTLLAFLGTGPTAWFVLTGLLLLLLALGAGPTPWSFLGGRRDDPRHHRELRGRPGEPRRVVAVLPHLGVRAGPDPCLHEPGGRDTRPTSCRSMASPTSRSGPPSRPRPAISTARCTRGSRSGRSTASSSSAPARARTSRWPSPTARSTSTPWRSTRDSHRSVETSIPRACTRTRASPSTSTTDGRS